MSISNHTSQDLVIVDDVMETVFINGKEMNVLSHELIDYVKRDSTFTLKLGTRSCFVPTSLPSRNPHAKMLATLKPIPYYCEIICKNWSILCATLPTRKLESS